MRQYGELRIQGESVAMGPDCWRERKVNVGAFPGAQFFSLGLTSQMFRFLSRAAVISTPHCGLNVAKNRSSEVS